MYRAVALCVLLGLVTAPAAAQATKYGVTVKADSKTDFTKFKSYAWEGGWEAFDPNAHKAILAAVDRELAGLGFEKRASGPSDVVLTYATLRRTDADLKAKPTGKEGELPTYQVGTLVVLVLEPGTRKELFRARVDTPIEAGRDNLQAAIDAAVAEMFAKYPTRTRK